MPSYAARCRRSVALRLPVVALILAFTAVPIELRRVDIGRIAEFVAFRVDVPDIVANVLGFLPLGMVLVDRRRSQAIGLAAALSMAIEVIQLFSEGRSPSLIDVTTNTLGAAIGFVLCTRLKIDLTRATIGPKAAVAAAVLALLVSETLAAQITPGNVEDAVTKAIANPPWRPVNDRGATAAGRLEAFWSFDSPTGPRVPDDSSNGVTAISVGGASFVDGVIGRAVGLNGHDQWVDAGDPLSLRLVGSMTITAWINSSAFPRDDAAIVSDHSGLGYQLDTTIDTGPRTVGFKLANASGKLIARYGRTRLQLSRWYHVAGVYDAAARTLDVYLQGRPDNGCLTGEVTTTQHPSGQRAFVGRRGNMQGYEFAGAIDEVHIYSRALTPSEIAEQAEQGALKRGLRLLYEDAASADNRRPGTCPPPEPSDPRTAGQVVIVGLLAVVATIGLWRGDRFRAAGLVVATSAGLLLLPAVAGIGPYFRWCVPLLTLAGGASVVTSARDDTK